MLDTTNELIPNQKGMTSLQIAEVTGKRHDAILRDIRNLLKQGVAAHNFVETSYTDKSNRQSPCFNLTPKGCLILASGYDAVLRERIINRLEYLENEKKVIKTPQTYLEALEALVASEKEKEQLRIETEQQQSKSSRKMQRLPNSSPKPTLPKPLSKKILFSFGNLLNCCTFAVRQFYIHIWIGDFLCPILNYCPKYKQRFLRTYSPQSRYGTVASWRNSLLFLCYSKNYAFLCSVQIIAVQSRKHSGIFCAHT